MVINSKLSVLAGLTLFIGSGFTLVQRTGTPTDFKNLKVLPKDISEHQLDSVMDKFSHALQVECSFCHSAAAGQANELDFALDGNPMKENAREMMRMTNDLNKKYFRVPDPASLRSALVVTCLTCHRGSPYPADLSAKDSLNHP